MDIPQIRLRSPEETRRCFGAQLRKLRTAANQTKGEMAATLGWTGERYRNLEDGRVMASAHEIYTLSIACGMRAGDLLHERNIEPNAVRLTLHLTRIREWAAFAGLAAALTPATEALANAAEYLAKLTKRDPPIG